MTSRGHVALLRGLLFGGLASCLTSPLFAYEQRVHVYLSERGYGGVATLDGPSALPSRLRERLWQLWSTSEDEALRQRFLLRYPSPERFDAWAWKQLFQLRPEAHVLGFDDAVALPAGVAAAVYAAASRAPDDDERNRDRFAHDLARAQRCDRWGRPLPADPATLEMGGRTGLSSQAHAHYGLPALAFSEDPSVLRSDPRRFAVPATVHTFGAAFVESYTDLAVLAAQLDGGSRLALTQAGAAAHHLEDVANQIHTVQVGLFAFFVDAKIESIKEELASGGGYFRSRPTFLSIGIDIIGNHHLLAEALYAKHLLAPGDPVAAAFTSSADDADFERQLSALPAGCAPGFGRALAALLIERSSFEGPRVYRAIRTLAEPRWSRAGQHFTEADDPDLALKPGADATEFYALQTAGARRALQGQRALWRYLAACPKTPAVERRFATALLRDRLDALEAQEGRARLFSPPPPAEESKNPWPLLGAAVLLLAPALWLLRHRRRRAAASDGASVSGS